MATAEDEKPTSPIPALLLPLIPQATVLSSSLYTHVSTNFHGTDVIRSVAGIIAAAPSILTTFHTTVETYPVSCEDSVCIILRSLEREFDNVEKVLEEALGKEADVDWLDDGQKVRTGRGDPRQVALQEGMMAVGPLGRVMVTIEDGLDCLAFLGVMAKAKGLMGIAEGERSDEQKREIKRAVEQYDFKTVQREKIMIKEVIDAALYQERAARMDDNVSDYGGHDRVIDRVVERPMTYREFDNRSIASFDSFASDQFVKPKAVYEYWILQKIEGESRVRSTWKFFGLTAREMMDDTSYTVEGKPRPQEEMKAKDEETRTEAEYHAREASIKATISTLSYRFQNELVLLMQDRERASSNVRFLREWSIVDIQPLKPKVTTKAQSWSGWWNGEGGISQWGCILKGETSFKQEAGKDYAANVRFPDRFRDAFRKSTYGPVVIDRDYDTRRYPEDERVIPRRPIAPRQAYPRQRIYPQKQKEPTQEMYKRAVEELFSGLEQSKDERQVKVEGF
ncbi:hypothetical protein GLAREA_07251 [Glarea lozoyensis ATCC 20868]|uniref:Uncharacterized protein n=1 Tax=Glarea lozoyensis (strain ATCC 20868 / MF5171) TaxID=1116229 RepID=S3E7D3_GLAL2|nr:uncharacterized protein GLAREA_07251 [Glarea lozoyensis ATCC 20868]EPE34238.1 hypothetical protein GLAREA_07251 [Glarea lozoyensis ATCC 20868]